LKAAEYAAGGLALQVEALGHRFPDGTWAFRGIDFSLRCGEISLLAGRSGAGKSCLAKHMAGLLDATEGRVLLPREAQCANKGSFAPYVGYLFQDARLQIVGETVLDDVLFGPSNLSIGPEAAMERAHAAISDCGLAGKEEAFVHSLSGGEMRRLAIAGLLAMRPRVLILDEPFANLDWEGIISVLEILKSLSGEHIALLIVTHEIEKVLGLAQILTILDMGSIVASGKPAEILSRGIEQFGLRDPLRQSRSIEDLSWLD
jgi:biotin transport system ATP-binding protein